MRSFHSLFLTTDFSSCSAYAEDCAVELAKRLDVKIQVAHVVDTGYLTYAALYGQSVVIEPDIQSVEDAARKHLEEVAARLRSRGADVTTHLVRGAPIVEILNLIGKSGAGLAVTGTHGRSGFNKFLLGSFCEKMLRQCPVPVLAIKQPGPTAKYTQGAFALERVCCTTDLSDHSRAALPVAADLCQRLNAELVLLHVVDSRYDALPLVRAVERPTHQHLHERAEKMLAEWATDLKLAHVQTCVLDGVPHVQIEGFARDQGIDLLVIATHGHGGVAHALLGSTTERVVRSVACPVLSVRPSQGR